MNAKITIEFSTADRDRLDRLHNDFQNLRRDIEAMNLKLSTAVAALVSSVAQEKTELASIKAYVVGQPDLIAAAVAKALSDADVSEADAADLIEQARADAASSVDDVLKAVTANTPSDTNSTTVSGGTGDDTLSSGTGDDTVSGGTGDDTLSSGADTTADAAGGQTVSNEVTGADAGVIEPPAGGTDGGDAPPNAN